MMQSIKILCTALVVSVPLLLSAKKNHSKSEDIPIVNLTRYVDPMIGTAGHGHVFLGANVPFGFIQLGPTQPYRGWDWCSGYHYSDSTLTGFSHTHLNGTGIGDLGDILLLPSVDDKKIASFSHSHETSRPGYYSVELNTSGIKVELTATSRVGFHRYTFPSNKKAKVLFNIFRGIGWDKYVSGKITQVDKYTLIGFRRSTGWAKNQRVYFKAVFSAPIINTVLQGDTVRLLSFALKTDHQLMVKVSLSATSVENAALNMKSELPDWNFDETRKAADMAWNAQLKKIIISSDNEKVKRIFYTSLYHTMFAPTLFCDVNRDYYGADGTNHVGVDFCNYSVFSLWDTYRAVHPLMTLIHRDRLPDIAQTFVHIFKQQGKLPIWHLMGNETNCMVGNPCIPVLADMLLKGIKMDREEAFEAMKQSAMIDERGLRELKKYGYLPYDKTVGITSVSTGLEYALADGTLALVAHRLGKEKDFSYFSNRSRSYAKYFDPQTHFMRALSSEGKFREPFNPSAASLADGDYVEGNAWQYTWLVPHDAHGLIGLFGGNKAFISKLDSLFTVSSDLGDKAPIDVDGLIGQYAHGNEPSHHIAYLYNYAGCPSKNAPIIRRIFSTFYSDRNDGLTGNEDEGQMSAWYVLSAMGLYQVEPSGGRFVFGSPILDKVSIQVSENRYFRIKTYRNDNRNMFIQMVKLNGREYTKSYIDYEDIMKGGLLEFYMGDAPSDFGTAEPDCP